MFLLRHDLATMKPILLHALISVPTHRFSLLPLVLSASGKGVRGSLALLPPPTNRYRCDHHDREKFSPRSSTLHLDRYSCTNKKKGVTQTKLRMK